MLSHKSSSIVDVIQSAIAASGEAVLKAALGKRVKIMAATDPAHIFIESISAFFGVSFVTAKFLCDFAVRRGQFQKRIGYRCPRHKNFILEIGANEVPPDKIDCGICEATGETSHPYLVSELEKVEYYAIR